MSKTITFPDQLEQGQLIKAVKYDDASLTNPQDFIEYTTPVIFVTDIDFTDTQNVVYDFTGSSFDPSTTSQFIHVHARVGNTLVEEIIVNFTSPTGTLAFTTPNIIYDNLLIFGRDNYLTIGYCSDSPVVPYQQNPGPTTIDFINIPYSDRAYAPAPNQQHSEYVDIDPAFGESAWRSTVQPIRGEVNTGSFQSQGGVVPDSIMYNNLRLNEADARANDSVSLKSYIGVPYQPDSTTDVYWAIPGNIDVNDLSNTAQQISTNSDGPYRNHVSFRYNIGDKDIRLKNGDAFKDVYGFDPYTPSGGIRYDFISFKAVDTGIEYDWPGQSISGSIDETHYAFNVFQTKGKHSAVVPFSGKWAGKYFRFVHQNEDNSSNQIYNVITPSTPNTGGEGMNGLKDKWIDFAFRLRIGKLSDAATLGYVPGVDVYYRIPEFSSTWTLAYSHDGDLVSGLNDPSWEATYGVTPNHLGLTNVGIYPSNRLSGEFKLIDWRDWTGDDTKYISAEYGEYSVCYYPNPSDDPGATLVLDAYDNHMDFIDQTSSNSGGGGGGTPVPSISYATIGYDGNVTPNDRWFTDSSNSLFTSNQLTSPLTYSWESTAPKDVIVQTISTDSRIAPVGNIASIKLDFTKASANFSPYRAAISLRDGIETKTDSDYLVTNGFANWYTDIGKELIVRFSMRFPSATNNLENWPVFNNGLDNPAAILLWQNRSTWHGPNRTPGNIPLQIKARGDELIAITSWDDTPLNSPNTGNVDESFAAIYLSKIQYDKWVDFVIRMRPGDQQDGEVEIWMRWEGETDFVQRFTYTGDWYGSKDYNKNGYERLPVDKSAGTPSVSIYGSTRTGDYNQIINKWLPAGVDTIEVEFSPIQAYQQDRDVIGMDDFLTDAKNNWY